jgi:hypothetical protein
VRRLHRIHPAVSLVYFREIARPDAKAQRAVIALQMQSQTLANLHFHFHKKKNLTRRRKAVTKFKTLYRDYSLLGIKDFWPPKPALMFVDYIQEILLFRQGPKICEDASAIFQLPGIAKDTNVKNWDAFLRFCLVAGDYVFKEDYRKIFLNGVDAQLGLLHHMQPVFESDEYNKKIYQRQELTLQTIKGALSGADVDVAANPFGQSWWAQTRASPALPAHV